MNERINRRSFLSFSSAAAALGVCGWQRRAAAAPMAGGGYPAEAYRTVFGGILGLQILSLLWYAGSVGMGRKDKEG